MAKKIVGFFSGEELEQMGGTKKLCNQPSSLYLGNSEDILKSFPDNSVDSVVTDSPYGLRFMGKRWDYDVPSVVLWSEVFRVLKPGGHLLSFGGTRTYHRMVVNIEDAGFEIRDQIDWLYGSGFPKSLDVSKAIDKMKGAEREVVGRDPIAAAKENRRPTNKTQCPKTHPGLVGLITAPATPEAKQWEGWGTALKPAHEPICLARKPLDGTVAENVLKWGTGGINVDGGRVFGEPSPSVLRRKHAAPKESVGVTGWVTPARPPHYNDQRHGEQLGRFPANFIHDGSDEVVRLFPVTGKSQGGRSGHTGAYGGGYNQEYYGDEKPGFGDSGSAARFFYCAKASRAERGEGNNHPTVKPLKLMEYLVRLVTPPGGVVLDPFMGSGTTGLACRNQGFGFIGIERDAASFEIAKRRIEGS